MQYGINGIIAACGLIMCSFVVGADQLATDIDLQGRDGPLLALTRLMQLARSSPKRGRSTFELSSVRRPQARARTLERRAGRQRANAKGR